MTEKNGVDVEDLALLTVSDFIRLAADRGKTLWTEMGEDGILRITNGSRKYVLPQLPGGRLPSALVESLCYRFDLPHLDFALDAQDEG
jgi:hypothetical protein